MRSLILAIALLGLAGCSTVTKKEMLKPEMSLKELDNNTTQIQRSEPAMQVIEVNADNFYIKTQTIPDKEIIKRAKIMGANLNDVIALLTEATNENIVFQVQSEAVGSTAASTTTGGTVGVAVSGGNDYLLSNTKINLSSSNMAFGKVLQKTIGDKLGIQYYDDTFYLGHVHTTTLKIPSVNGLSAAMSTSLSSMGATNVAFDSVTSTISFSAKEKEYGDIMNYLKILRDNLYVIEYEISIYTVDLKDNYALGINWSLIPSMAENGIGFIASSAASLGAAGTTAAPLTFGMLMKNDQYNGQALVNALENFGKVESVQRPKLLGLAGTTVTLTDGVQTPYISGITSTSVANGTAQLSTTSATALSGLNINLKSNMLDGTVITDIGLTINDVVGFTNFEVGATKFSQPTTVTKAINNTMRVQPGVPIVISGLFRNKTDKGWNGLPGLGDTSAAVVGGARSTASTKSEMVIIVTPRVIKYVMK
ncbi:MAG: ral secretion pathway protein [Campylobacterota bacterium]|nr:ral secretion pathway protein [Campylobacterota bacterium]